MVYNRGAYKHRRCASQPDYGYANKYRKEKIGTIKDDVDICAPIIDNANQKIINKLNIILDLSKEQKKLNDKIISYLSKIEPKEALNQLEEFIENSKLKHFKSILESKIGKSSKKDLSIIEILGNKIINKEIKTKKELDKEKIKICKKLKKPIPKNRDILEFVGVELK